MSRLAFQPGSVLVFAERRKFSEFLTETPARKHYNVGVIHYDASVVA